VVAVALVLAVGPTAASAGASSERTKLHEAKVWYRQAKQQARQIYLEFKEITYECPWSAARCSREFKERLAKAKVRYERRLGHLKERYEARVKRIHKGLESQAELEREQHEEEKELEEEAAEPAAVP
jgi:hypothetical protein